MGAKIQKVNAFEAKTRISELLRETEQGASYITCRCGKEVARLTPPLKETKDELESIKEEIIREFHVCCMDMIGHLRVVDEGINKFSDRLDIFHEEIKQTIDDNLVKSKFSPPPAGGD